MSLCGLSKIFKCIALIMVFLYFISKMVLKWTCRILTIVLKSGLPNLWVFPLSALELILTHIHTHKTPFAHAHTHMHTHTHTHTHTNTHIHLIQYRNYWNFNAIELKHFVEIKKFFQSKLLMHNWLAYEV